MLSITQVLQAAQLAGTSLGFSFSVSPGFEQDGFMKKCDRNRAMFTLQFAPLALLSSNASSAPWLRLFMKHKIQRSKVFAWWQRQAGGQLRGRPRWKAKPQGRPVCANIPEMRERKTIGQKKKFKTIRGTNFSRGMYLDLSGLLAVDPCHSFLQTNWGPLCWSAPPENQRWASYCSRILFYDTKAGFW